MSIMDYMDNPYAPTAFGPSRRAGLSVAKDAPATPATPAPNPVPAGGGPPPAAAPTTPAAQAPGAPGQVTAALPYSWYRDHFMQNQNLDDAGRSTQAISEEQWNAMSPQEQFNLFNSSSYGVDTKDPFYQQVNSRYNAAGNQGNGVIVNGSEASRFKDPSRVWTDPDTGLQMTDRDNLVQYHHGVESWMPLAVIGGGLAGNALLGAEAAGGAGAGAVPAAEGGAGAIPDLLSPVTAGSTPELLTAPELAGGLPAAEAGAGAAVPAAGLGGAPEAAGAALPGVTPSSVPFEGTPFPLTDPGVTIPPTPAIPGGSGSTSFTDRIINGITNNPLAAVGVGANLFAQGRANRSGTSEADKVRDVVKPISDQGRTLLEQYGKGELNPADEFNINRWEHEQIAKTKAYYAKAGMGDSTSALAAEGRVREQAQGMRDTALKGILQMGLQASGMAVGPLIQAIQLESKGDEQFAQSMSSALNSLMLLQAWQSKTPGVDA